ncbi:hypothetical protein MXM33_07545 [Acinetobacter vivianii]|uniref:hypothetical protein n=1 Tax=Acinetobacter vivianii TaxID=1776742 RepID=UPI002DB9F392|nr:hypothetical protein [Acinetobacter vivianii]MEB6666884.1 hypothetical protein [Acinetobacter vivianii]
MSEFDNLINDITKNMSSQTLQEIKIKGCSNLPPGACINMGGTGGNNGGPKPLRMIAYEDMIKNLDK